MLSYMAPSVSDKPPAAPSRLTLDHHKSAAATGTAYRRFGRPPSVTFGEEPDSQQGNREGFGALPVPPVRRPMAKEDSASSIASSVDTLLPATQDKRPANKPVTLKRSASGLLRFSTERGGLEPTLPRSTGTLKLTYKEKGILL